MSGTFDYPPASSSSGEGFSAQLQRIREALQRERGQERAERDAAATERQSQAQMSSSGRTRRSQFSRGRIMSPPFINDSRNTRRPADESAVPPLPRPTYNSDRQGSTPWSERYRSSRRRTRDQQEFDDTIADLAAMDAAIPAVPPWPESLSGPLPTAFDQQFQHYNRQRAKRRKLNYDDNRYGFQGFQYGYFGQVVPGRLKMEIVSCDGGEYSEQSSRTSSLTFSPENILVNNKSVYCTTSSRCNIILRHQGETTFSLDRLVIKAPDKGFTAPVQEGMIFVSMKSENLLSRTAHYQIEYPPPSTGSSPSSSTSSRDNERLTILESLNDPIIQEGWRRHREGRNQENADNFIRQRRRAALLGLLRSRNTQRTLNQDENGTNPCEDERGEDSGLPPPEAGIPRPPPFRVTTQSDADESDEEHTSAAVLVDRYSREARFFTDTSEDSDELSPRRIFREARNDYRAASGTNYLRAARRVEPARIDTNEATTQDGDSDILPYHARFFIEKHKSKITVKFEPPVSGKFVLLKLWSPLHNGNIDIQSVATYGYAGPRYFPACELR
ncbi:hypothetical protein M501DRAFT_1000975 [Patellaria atrata CBS 101060]|uniref:Uncharacterized protein n=1 Tax=Patellaria atrata CBS 101060 TaxID=1346257 RepID=A0A9P4SG47_9PEZI|nr:hypothetical protein M501DRAFT_1000975 [Patellaria atrata CBS 101060]